MVPPGVQGRGAQVQGGGSEAPGGAVLSFPPSSLRLCCSLSSAQKPQQTLTLPGSLAQPLSVPREPTARELQTSTYLATAPQPTSFAAPWPGTVPRLCQETASRKLLVGLCWAGAD